MEWRRVSPVLSVPIKIVAITSNQMWNYSPVAKFSFVFVSVVLSEIYIFEFTTERVQTTNQPSDVSP